MAPKILVRRRIGDVRRFTGRGRRVTACVPLVFRAALAFVVLTSVAAAAGAITAVEVVGQRRVAIETIRSHLLLAPGVPYDAARADQSVRALFATGHFSDVRIERHGTKLVVKVEENPLLASVSLAGNTAIAKAKLEPVLKLRKGAPYTRAGARADANRLRDHYRREGYYRAAVEPVAIPAGDGRVNLTFSISEGDLNKIKTIRFSGNQAFSEDRLRDVITSTQSGWLDILKTNLTYDEDRLTLDRELIRRHYLKNGYADVSVSSHQADFDAATGTFAISFAIDEGQRYRFGAVSIESSLPDLDSTALAKALVARTGEIYNQELIDKSEDRLMLALTEHAKPFAQLRIVPARDPASRTIGLKFVIEDGPRVYVERIEITGNTKTNHQVIRRELGFAEGGGISDFMLRRAIMRVKALGFFKSVEIEKKKGSAADKIVVVVKIVEEETIDLSFGAGYSSSEGVIGDVSVTERNLLGNGQWLRLKLAGSLTRLQADVGFTDPRFLGTRMAAGVDLFYKDVDYSRESSYKTHKAGGVLRLGIPVTDETTVGFNYKLSRSTLYDVGDEASAAVKEAVSGASSTTYYTSSVGYSGTYDTRDSRKTPTSGIYAKFEQDVAGAGGDVRYIRSIGEARGYYQAMDGVTLIGRGWAGTIAGWGGDEVRLLDMFYMGGDHVRGFASRGIGPRDTQSRNKDALGGTTFYAFTAESRVDIPRVTESTGLRAAVFADAGSLWGVNSTSGSLPGLAGNAPSLRASTGVGLVWDSPLGPLRLDYAVPLVKQNSDVIQPLSFGLANY